MSLTSVFPEHITQVKQFEAAASAEVKGEYFEGWLKNQRAEYTMPVLESRGISQINAEEWYPFQLFLDVAKNFVIKKHNATQILVAVGKAGSENFPVNHFDTMDDFKSFIESIHKMAVRGVPEYENLYLHSDSGNYYLINNTPNPNDLFYGWCWALLRTRPIGGEFYRPMPQENYPGNTLPAILRLDKLHSQFA